jgi:hypothetical protein
MIDKPCGNKDFQKQGPYHTCKEFQGRTLFYLYDQKIADISIAGMGQRKRGGILP